MDTVHNNTSPTCSPLLQHAATPPVTITPPPTPLSRPNPGPLVQEGTPDTRIPHHKNHNPTRDSAQPHQPATVTQTDTADLISLTIGPTNQSTSPSNTHPLSPTPNAAQKRPSIAAPVRDPAHALRMRTKPPFTSHQNSSLGQPIGERGTFATGTEKTMAPSTPAQ